MGGAGVKLGLGMLALAPVISPSSLVGVEWDAGDFCFAPLLGGCIKVGVDRPLSAQLWRGIRSPRCGGGVGPKDARVPRVGGYGWGAW